MDIKKYEAMAKLDLPEDGRKWVTEQILRFSVLNSIDTSGVEPYELSDGQNFLREDEAVKTVTREELLANAPEQYDGYFQIPRTVL